MKKKENNYDYILKALLTFFIFYYSFLFQYIPVKLFGIKNLTPAINVLLNAFSNIVIMITFIFMYRKELKEEWKIFKKDAWNCINTGFVYWFLGFVIMIISNVLINYFFHSGGAANEKLVQNMISTLPWIMLINAGFIASFNEEIVFRKMFRNLFNSKMVFIILSGLVFGFMHVYSNISSVGDFLYIIPYGVLGSALAMTYDKTKTFFTGYFFHMFHNTALILLSILIL